MNFDPSMFRMTSTSVDVVNRSSASYSAEQKVALSGPVECSLCQLACSALPPGPAQQACYLACQLTVC